MIDLNPNFDYHVLIEPGAIQDLDGNPFPGFADPTVWNFATITTGDMTGPVLGGIGPADNSIDVPVDANFVVSFDEPVQVNPGPVAINIFRLDNNTIFTSAFTNSGNVTVDGNSVTINPPVDLEPGVEYGINVPPFGH